MATWLRGEQTVKLSHLNIVDGKEESAKLLTHMLHADPHDPRVPSFPTIPLLAVQDWKIPRRAALAVQKYFTVSSCEFSFLFPLYFPRPSFPALPNTTPT